MTSTASTTKAFTVVNASGNRTGGDLPRIVLYKADGTPYSIPTKQAAQANSTAADVASLVADFNALLAKLRLAGILS